MARLEHPAVQRILQSTSLAHLATIGPRGEAQCSPMWFLWDGECLLFTHTTQRQKYRNVRRDPRVAVSITDPDDPYVYAEFRGRVARIEDDPTGSLYDTLAVRYGSERRYRGDPRVILRVTVHHVVGQGL